MSSAEFKPLNSGVGVSAAGRKDYAADRVAPRAALPPAHAPLVARLELGRAFRAGAVGVDLQQQRVEAARGFHLLAVLERVEDGLGFGYLFLSRQHLFFFSTANPFSLEQYNKPTRSCSKSMS